MRDTLCSYYTNSKDITSYMIRRLGIAEADVILEPSAGEGAFVDEILQTEEAVKIHALDINGEAISSLEDKYKNNRSVTVRKADTLLDNELDQLSTTGGYYDKIIGNPPYGAWQQPESRAILLYSPFRA